MKIAKISSQRHDHLTAHLTQERRIPVINGSLKLQSEQTEIYKLKQLQGIGNPIDNRLLSSLADLYSTQRQPRQKMVARRCGSGWVRAGVQSLNFRIDSGPCAQCFGRAQTSGHHLMWSRGPYSRFYIVLFSNRISFHSFPYSSLVIFTQEVFT